MHLLLTLFQKPLFTGALDIGDRRVFYITHGKGNKYLLNDCFVYSGERKVWILCEEINGTVVIAHVISQGTIITSCRATKCKEGWKIKLETPTAPKIPIGPFYVILVVDDAEIIYLDRPFYIISPKARDVNLPRANGRSENMVACVAQLATSFNMEKVTDYIPDAWFTNSIMTG